MYVAPYLGAWIEIEVLLTNGCVMYVAPYLGAWIEIGHHDDDHRDTGHVAPYLGAWIEIHLQKDDFLSKKSHPTWVRGLKSRLTRL